MKYDDLRKIIEDAERYQKDNFLKQAEMFINWYEGRFKGSGKREIPYIVNLTYQIAKTIRVSIYSENPSFQVKIGQSVEDDTTRRKTARLLEEGLKHILSRMQIHRVNRRVIDDAVVCGFGCTKLGYRVNGGNKELDTPSVTSNKKDEPFVNRISPLNIILPPEATTLMSLPYICEIIWLKKEVAEKYFKKEDLPTETKENERNQVEYVKIYEFHDYVDNKIYTMIEGVDKIVNKVDYPIYDNDGNCKNMYQLLWFNDNISDKIYPVSDIFYVMSQISEANDAVERRINFARKSRAGLFLTGNWDEDDLKNLKEGDDGYIIKSLTGDGKVTNVPMMTLGQEFYQNIEYIRQEIFETLGITDYMVGSGGGRMATEAQLIERSRLDRVGDRVRIIEDFYFTQVDTLIELMKQYQEVGIEISELYNNEIIAGELNSELLKTTDAQIVVIPGSTVELDGTKELMKMEKIIQMAAALDPMVAQEVFKRLLEREGFGDLVQNITPQAMQQPDIPGMQGVEGVPSQTPMERGELPNLGSVEGLS